MAIKLISAVTGLRGCYLPLCDSLPSSPVFEGFVPRLTEMLLAVLASLAGLLALCLVLLAAALLYILALHRSVRNFEHKLSWQCAETRAWMRALSAPVIEPATPFSKMLQCLWPHFGAKRIKALIVKTCQAAISKLAAKCAFVRAAGWVFPCY